MNLKGRSFLTLKDFTPEEIMYMVDLAAELKAKKKQGITGNSLKGKNIALIFEKPSTRTRCSFTIGCLTVSSSAVFRRKPSRNLQSTAGCRSGTDSRMNTIRHRYWRTS